MNLNLQSPREENEGLTRYVMCCAGPAKAEAEGDAAATATAATAAADSGAGTVGRVAALVRTFHPILYDRSHGWGGSTYDAAAQFCAERGDRVLCREEV